MSIFNVRAYVRGRYQRLLDRVGIIYLWAVLLFVGSIFTTLQSSPVLDQFNTDLHLNITYKTVALLFFAGAFFTPLLLLPVLTRANWLVRVYLYIICGSPLPIYTIPVGWVLVRTGTNVVTGAVLLIVIVALTIIALAIWRPTPEQKD